MAGLHISVHPDHFEELNAHCERSGYFEELITHLDSGLVSERAHFDTYTELGILFAECKTEPLPLQQAVFLHTHYVEYNSAANTMLQHSPSAFMHDHFQSIM